MPQDPYYGEDKKGEACRLAVARGELSLNPNAENHIGNYVFYGIVQGDPVYESKLIAASNEAEKQECEAFER